MRVEIIRDRLLQVFVQLSPKAKELLSGSIWSLFGALISKSLIFLAWVVVARILGSYGYGQFGIVRSTILMFTTFAGFSLGITASRYVAELKENNKAKAGRILGLTLYFGFIAGALVSIAFYFASPWLALNTLHSPEITDELQIGALILFFSALNGAQIGALQGFQAFRQIAIINTMQGIISIPLFIIGAYWGGVNGTIWAYAISTIFICFLSHRSIKSEAVKNDIIIDYRQGWKEKSLLITYSLPALLGGLMVSPVKWATDAMLVTNTGFKQMGILTAAFTLQNLILMGANMLDAPFIAVMAKNKGADKDSLFSRMNILIPWIIGITIALPFMAFPELAANIFGNDYSGKDFQWTFTIISFFTVIIMFKQGLSRILAIFDLQWWGLLSNLIWGIFLLGSFTLMETHDSLSLALSYLIAYIANTLIIMPLYFKKKLVPPRTILSKNAIIIWGLLISTALAGLYIDNILVKTTILVITAFLIFKSLKNLISC